MTKALQTRSNIDQDQRKFQKNGNVGRRNTVANLMKAQNKELNNDEPYNLEKQFRKSFARMSKSLEVIFADFVLNSTYFTEPEEMAESEIPALRRMSTRRGTMNILTSRRDSYFQGERRRSTVRFERRMSQMEQDPV